MAARRYNLPLGDFPNAARMKASLREVASLPSLLLHYSQAFSSVIQKSMSLEYEPPAGREIGNLIAEQPAPTPHLARKEGCAVLRIVLVPPSSS